MHLANVMFARRHCKVLSQYCTNFHQYQILKYAYKQNGNKTSSGDGSLSLRRDVAATWLWTKLQWGLKAYLILRNNGKP